jgi:hypothetical protein
MRKIHIIGLIWLASPSSTRIVKYCLNNRRGQLCLPPGSPLSKHIPGEMHWKCLEWDWAVDDGDLGIKHFGPNYLLFCQMCCEVIFGTPCIVKWYSLVWPWPWPWTWSIPRWNRRFGLNGFFTFPIMALIISVTKEMCCFHHKRISIERSDLKDLRNRIPYRFLARGESIVLDHLELYHFRDPSYSIRFAK